MTDRPLRVLAVLAHPDDETLGAGGTLAWLSRRAQVVLVTATRGERGEVLGPYAATLAGNRYALGLHREAELANAAAALGVGRQLFLDQLAGGGPRYTDSGMAWADPSHTRAVPAPDADPDAFSLADIDVAAGPLAALIGEYDPDLVLTEEPGGGYGHPDHIQANRVATRAVELSQRTPVLAWFARIEESERAAMRWLSARDDLPTGADGEALAPRDPDGPLPSMVVPTADVVLDVRAEVPRLAAAMNAHLTQVQGVQVIEDEPLAGGWFALSDGVLVPIPVQVALRVAPGHNPQALRALLDAAARSAADGRLARHVADYLPPRWHRALAAALVVAAGLLLGAVGTAFHRVSPPWGMVTALLAIVAGAVLARAVRHRRGLAVYALAVIAVVLLMTYLRPGDDLLVTNEPISLVWMLASILISGVAALLPARWFRDH